jgi:uncharacterized protein (DUF1800 family)
VIAGLGLLFSPLGVARVIHLKGSTEGRYAAFYKSLSKEERFHHALDRLTFGPRPGALQQIELAGLNKWIKGQLHPESVPEDPSLSDRLLPYDSLRMSAEQNHLRYPSQQFVRAVARGNEPPPDDPVLRAIVLRLADRYRQRKQADLPAGKTGADAAGKTFDDLDAEVRTRPSERLTPAEVQVVDRGSPEQKKNLLASIPPAEQLHFALALRPRERQQLMNLAPVNFRRELMLTTNPQSVITSDLSEGKLLRAIYSTHQLRELLVDFWFNHFNVFAGKGAEPYLLSSYEREAIRPHVFGKFYDLLLATAKSPAMLLYLDNWQSVGPEALDRRAFKIQARKRGLNENYGRELMELHTLGVDGGYTQKDVIEVARCFTGWTIRRPQKDGEFQYNDKVHDHGQKIVLGHVIPAGGGMSDGLTVLKILAHQPATAHFISLKLAQKFVADDPPPALVEKMANTFLRTDGDLRRVTQTMLASREFWSQGAYRAKVKTPFEMVVSAVRATDAQVDSAYALADEIRRLGEPLYQKVEPTGYSNANVDWVDSAGLLGRMNFALALAHNRIAGARIDPTLWQTGGTNDTDAVARTLLQREPDEQTLAAIGKLMADPGLQKQVNAQAHPGPPQTFGLVAGLVVGSPEFQRR